MKFALVLISSVFALWAQAPLFRPGAAPAAAKSAADPFVKRLAYVAIDWNALAGSGTAESVAKSLNLNLFGDASFVAQRTRLNWLGRGRFDWVGKIGDDDVVLSVRDGFMHGSVQRFDRVFEIENADGLSQRITEVDLEAFNRLEKAHPVDVEGPVENLPEIPLLPGQADPVIDVMVVYLKEASSKIPNMETFLASLFTLSNQAYVNSAIPQTIRLVHHQEVVSGIVGRENLNWLKADPGVAALRDQYGADLVSMILEVHDAAGTTSGNFSICTRSAAYSNKTFPHELGHSMGAQHAWEQFTTHSGYAYGYINHAKSWRTIMSYAECNAGGACTRVNWFSNPDVLYNGDPAGIADSRDNARMMRSRSVAISNLKPTKVGPTGLVGREIVEAPAAFTVRAASRNALELRVTRGANLDITLESLDGKAIGIAHRNFDPGTHRLEWAPGKISAGIHFLRVRGNGEQWVRKISVVQ